MTTIKAPTRALAPAPANPALSARGLKPKSVEVRVFQEDDGTLRALFLLRGATKKVYAVQVTGARVTTSTDTAVSGEDFGADFGADEFGGPLGQLAYPAINAIAKFLSNPMVAAAAAASVLIPGVGPAWLASYALGSSVANTLERRGRSQG